MAKVQRERLNIFQGQHLGMPTQNSVRISDKIALSKKIRHIERSKSGLPALNELDLNGMDPNQLRMVI